MNKKNIIKKNREFEEIIKKNRPIKNEYFSLYCQSNNLNTYRFGIAISKKIGKATTRNKKKRQIKTIINMIQKEFKKEFDCIIIVSSKVTSLCFNDMKLKLVDIFIKSKLLELENNDENK